MKKLRVLALAGLLLFGYRVAFAEISGELGITATENDTDIFVKIETIRDFEVAEFRLGAAVERSRSNEQTTRDNFKMWSEYKENFGELFISGDILFEDDSVNNYQKTSATVNIGKDIDLGEADLMIKAGVGRSWSNNLDATVFKVEDEIIWKTLYQKGKIVSAFDNFDELEICSEIGVKTEITKNLALKTSYEIKYKEVFIDKYNHIFRTALSFSF